MRLKLGRGRRRYETSTEAYDLYLRARAFSAFDAMGRSVDLYQQAIAKDPSFAPAYAGLAAAHAWRSGVFSYDPSDEVPRMREAAEKAIQLDPLLAEAHDALGIAYARDAQWEQSEKSFRRSIELEPNTSGWRRDFAAFLLEPLGRIKEAIQQFQLAEKIDPFRSHILLADALVVTGRYDEAAAYCEKLSANHKGECLARARFWQGKTVEAIRILDSAGGRPAGFDIRFLGYAYASVGRREEAEKLAATARPFDQSAIFAGLGDKDRAFQALERGVTAGPVRIGRVLNAPEMALLRGDPRVKALRKKVGLPE